MEHIMTTTLITTGNLTENAKTKTDKNGRSYVLLRLASNEYQRDKKGEIVRDKNNYPVAKQTYPPTRSHLVPCQLRYDL